ncbi:hypothetical protein MHBO_000763 [Bonamia ostreae]|uniref:BZIP domain-containing protein n=1 Tax=Bonamia ostreae TaxID=126728 RepID=A0ABV2AGX7_9EUKA
MRNLTEQEKSKFMQKTLDQRRKKAQRAKESRLKKKKYIESLERKRDQLKLKLSMLETDVNNNAMVNKSHCDKQSKVKKMMFEQLEKKLDVDEALEDYIKIFKRNSRSRQHLSQYFLSKVGDSLVPDVETKFILWGLGMQKSKFYTNKNGVFHRVMVEKLKLSNKQYEKLLSYRGTAKSLCALLRQCLKELSLYEKELIAMLKAQHDHIDEVSANFSPREIANFCRWVDQNQNMMFMLNAFWDF